MPQDQTQEKGFWRKLIDYLNPFNPDPYYPLKERREARRAKERADHAKEWSAQLKKEIKQMQEKGSALTGEERKELHRKMYMQKLYSRATQPLQRHEQDARQIYEQRMEQFYASFPMAPGREKGPRVREDYLAGAPEVVANFMRAFQPQNELDKQRFDYLVKQLEEGKSLKSHYFILADIGYGDVLNHLYQNSPKSYEVRCRVMENPNCPEHLLYEGLKDDHPLVRKAAVENQNLGQILVHAHAYREQDPAVQKALRERLGDSHPEKAFQNGNPVLRPFEPIASIGKPPQEAQKIMEQQKKPSLDARIKGAQVRHEEQLAAFKKAKEQGLVIGGKAETPFVPSGR